MDIKKRDFLLAGVGAAIATEAAAQAQPRWAWSGKQPASVDASYKPRRLNKCVELWEDGQPMYYVSWGPSGDGDGYETGKKMAQTWADCICIDLEHGCFDLADVRKFMRGLVDGGPTRSGHATPAHPSNPHHESRNRNRWIFPVAVFGRPSTNSIQRGYFHTPIRCFTCSFNSSPSPT